MIKEEELLRKLRGHLAFKSGVEPYKIFNDKNLAALLEAKPKTIQALGAVKGFPIDGKRVAAWGQAIIDIFTRADKVEDFEVELDKDGEPVAKTKLKPMSFFGK